MRDSQTADIMVQRRSKRGAFRILSLDPHIDRIGYAFFDGNHLSDWGIKNVRTGRRSVRVRRLLIPFLVDTLDRYAPQVLLMPPVEAAGVRSRSEHVRTAIGAVRREAIRRDIDVHLLGDRQVKAAFQSVGGKSVKNKYAINAILVQWFPELTTFRPRARRLWDSEGYATPLFNAVALHWAWRYKSSQ